MKIAYTKPVLSYPEQVSLLKKRGLIIPDDDFAEHTLSHVNYYRLSAYMFPFLEDKPNHIFKNGTEFQNILDLYAFDKGLRSLVFSAIAEIEVSVRTNILYELAYNYGAFWITNNSIFYNQKRYSSHLSKLKDELARSDEEFLVHFFSKYSDEIPPVWMSLEIASFGTISQLFENINVRKIQKNVAKLYNLPYQVFSSWIHTLAYVRNLSAHHARLWNRRLGVIPVLPKAEITGWLENLEINNKRIYIVISIISHFLSIISPTNDFISKFKSLLSKYPHTDVTAMGFPKGWERELVFKQEAE